jgi:hypothetical protein
VSFNYAVSVTCWCQPDGLSQTYQTTRQLWPTVLHNAVPTFICLLHTWALQNMENLLKSICDTDVICKIQPSDITGCYCISDNDRCIVPNIDFHLITECHIIGSSQSWVCVMQCTVSCALNACIDARTSSALDHRLIHSACEHARAAELVLQHNALHNCSVNQSPRLRFDTPRYWYKGLTRHGVLITRQGNTAAPKTLGQGTTAASDSVIK